MTVHIHNTLGNIHIGQHLSHVIRINDMRRSAATCRYCTYGNDSKGYVGKMLQNSVSFFLDTFTTFLIKSTDLGIGSDEDILVIEYYKNNHAHGYGSIGKIEHRIKE